MVRTAVSIIARLVAAGIIIAIAAAGVLVTAGATSAADRPGHLQVGVFSWLPDPWLGLTYFLLGCLGALAGVSLLAFVPSLGSRLEQMRLQADLDELREQQDLVVQMRLAAMGERSELTREQTRLVVGLSMLGRDIDRLAGNVRTQMQAETRWRLARNLPAIVLGGVVATLFTGMTVVARPTGLEARLLQAVCWGLLWVGLIAAVDGLRAAAQSASVARSTPASRLARRVADIDVRLQAEVRAVEHSVAEGRSAIDAQLATLGERLTRLEQAVARLEPPVGDLPALPGATTEHARLLRQAGINSQAELLRRAGSPDSRRQLEGRTGISQAQLLRWVNRAELLQIAGFGPDHAELLRAAGVGSLRELAQRNPAYLQSRLAEANSHEHLVTPTPTLRQVTAWIEAAKRLSPAAGREPAQVSTFAPQG